MSAILWFHRDRIPWHYRSFFVLTAITTVSLSMVAWLVYDSVLGIIAALGAVYFLVVTLAGLHFHYWARGNRSYRSARRYLKALERCVQEGLIAEYYPRDHFKRARHYASRVILARRRLPIERLFSARRTTWTVWTYEKFMDTDLKRIVDLMPPIDRPHFAVEVCGYYDAKNISEYVLHDADVLHCTRMQLVALLDKAVCSEYGQEELLKLIRTVVRDARNMNLFGESADEQAEMLKCEPDVCSELHVAIQALLRVSIPWRLSPSDLQCLLAFEQSQADLHASHNKPQIDGCAERLRSAL